jgi:hypothetical protein
LFHTTDGGYSLVVRMKLRKKALEHTGTGRCLGTLADVFAVDENVEIDVLESDSDGECCPMVEKLNTITKLKSPKLSSPAFRANLQ